MIIFQVLLIPLVLFLLLGMVFVIGITGTCLPSESSLSDVPGKDLKTSDQSHDTLPTSL